MESYVSFNYNRCHHFIVKLLKRRCEANGKVSIKDEKDCDSFTMSCLTNKNKWVFKRNSESKLFMVSYDSNPIMELANEHLQGLFDTEEIFSLACKLNNLRISTGYDLRIVKNHLKLYDHDQTVVNFDLKNVLTNFDKIYKTTKFSFQCINGKTFGEDDMDFFALNRCLLISPSFLQCFALSHDLLELVQLSLIYLKCFWVLPICCDMQSLSTNVSIAPHLSYSKIYLNQNHDILLRISKLLYPILENEESSLLSKDYFQVIPSIIIEFRKLEKFCETFTSLRTAKASIAVLRDGYHLRVFNHFDIDIRLFVSLHDISALKAAESIISQLSFLTFYRADKIFSLENSTIFEYYEVFTLKYDKQAEKRKIYSLFSPIQYFPYCKRISCSDSKAIILLDNAPLAIMKDNIPNDSEKRKELISKLCEIIRLYAASFDVHPKHYIEKYLLLSLNQHTETKGHRYYRIKAKRNKILINERILVPKWQSDSVLIKNIAEILQTLEDQYGICLFYENETFQIFPPKFMQNVQPYHSWMSERFLEDGSDFSLSVAEIQQYISTNKDGSNSAKKVGNAYVNTEKIAENVEDGGHKTSRFRSVKMSKTVFEEAETFEPCSDTSSTPEHQEALRRMVDDIFGHFIPSESTVSGEIKDTEEDNNEKIKGTETSKSSEQDNIEYVAARNINQEAGPCPIRHLTLSDVEDEDVYVSISNPFRKTAEYRPNKEHDIETENVISDLTYNTITQKVNEIQKDVDTSDEYFYTIMKDGFVSFSSASSNGGGMQIHLSLLLLSSANELISNILKLCKLNNFVVFEPFNKIKTMSTNVSINDTQLKNLPIEDLKILCSSLHPCLKHLLPNQWENNNFRWIPMCLANLNATHITHLREVVETFAKKNIEVQMVKNKLYLSKSVMVPLNLCSDDIETLVNICKLLETIEPISGSKLYFDRNYILTSDSKKGDSHMKSRAQQFVSFAVKKNVKIILSGDTFILNACFLVSISVLGDLKDADMKTLLEIIIVYGKLKKYKTSYLYMLWYEEMFVEEASYFSTIEEFKVTFDEILEILQPNLNILSSEQLKSVQVFPRSLLIGNPRILLSSLKTLKSLHLEVKLTVSGNLVIQDIELTIQQLINNKERRLPELLDRLSTLKEKFEKKFFIYATGYFSNSSSIFEEETNRDLQVSQIDVKPPEIQQRETMFIEILTTVLRKEKPDFSFRINSAGVVMIGTNFWGYCESFFSRKFQRSFNENSVETNAKSLIIDLSEILKVVTLYSEIITNNKSSNFQSITARSLYTDTKRIFPDILKLIPENLRTAAVPKFQYIENELRKIFEKEYNIDETYINEALSLAKKLNNILTHVDDAVIMDSRFDVIPSGGDIINLINVFDSMNSANISWIVLLDGNVNIENCLIVTFDHLTNLKIENLTLLLKAINQMPFEMVLSCQEAVEKDKMICRKFFDTNIDYDILLKAKEKADKFLSKKGDIPGAKIEKNGTLFFMNNQWLKAADFISSSENKNANIYYQLSVAARQTFGDSFKFQIGQHSEVIIPPKSSSMDDDFFYCELFCSVLKQRFERNGKKLDFIFDAESKSFILNNCLLIHPKTFLQLQNVETFVKILVEIGNIQNTSFNQSEVDSKIIGYLQGLPDEDKNSWRKYNRLTLDPVKRYCYAKIGEIIYDYCQYFTKKNCPSWLADIKNNITNERDALYNIDNALGTIFGKEFEISAVDSSDNVLKLNAANDDIIVALRLAISLDIIEPCQNFPSFFAIVETVKAIKDGKQVDGNGKMVIKEKLNLKETMMYEKEFEYDAYNKLVKKIRTELQKIYVAQANCRYVFGSNLFALHHWYKHGEIARDIKDFYLLMENFFENTKNITVELGTQDGSKFNKNYKDEKLFGVLHVDQKNASKFNVVTLYPIKSKKSELNAFKTLDDKLELLVITDFEMKFKDVSLSENIMVAFLNPKKKPHLFVEFIKKDAATKIKKILVIFTGKYPSTYVRTFLESLLKNKLSGLENIYVCSDIPKVLEEVPENEKILARSTELEYLHTGMRCNHIWKFSESSDYLRKTYIETKLL